MCRMGLLPRFAHHDQRRADARIDRARGDCHDRRVADDGLGACAVATAPPLSRRASHLACGCRLFGFAWNRAHSGGDQARALSPSNQLPSPARSGVRARVNLERA